MCQVVGQLPMHLPVAKPTLSCAVTAAADAAAVVGGDGTIASMAHSDEPFALLRLETSADCHVFMHFGQLTLCCE